MPRGHVDWLSFQTEKPSHVFHSVFPVPAGLHPGALSAAPIGVSVGEDAGAHIGQRSAVCHALCAEANSSPHLGVVNTQNPVSLTMASLLPRLCPVLLWSLKGHFPRSACITFGVTVILGNEDIPAQALRSRVV